MKNRISCICITYNRISFLKKSLSDFYKQSHKYKELIIIAQKNDSETVEYLNEIILKKQLIFDVKMILVDSDMSVGEKRNIAIHHSSGDLICIWDDDDRHHKKRLQYQLKALDLTNKKACTLSSILMYDIKSKSYYVCPNRPCGWEGSLLCYKDNMLKYLSLNRHEDVHVLESLKEQGQLFVLNMPFLYVYNYHHNNVSGESHFKRIIHYSLKI